MDVGVWATMAIHCYTITTSQRELFIIKNKIIPSINGERRCRSWRKMRARHWRASQPLEVGEIASSNTKEGAWVTTLRGLSVRSVTLTGEHLKSTAASLSVSEADLLSSTFATAASKTTDWVMSASFATHAKFYKKYVCQYPATLITPALRKYLPNDGRISSSARNKTHALSSVRSAVFSRLDTDVTSQMSFSSFSS